MFNNLSYDRVLFNIDIVGKVLTRGPKSSDGSVPTGDVIILVMSMMIVFESMVDLLNNVTHFFPRRIA